MTNMHAKKKGYVLITVIIFGVITLITILALFTAVSNTCKIVGVGETDRVKGYYAALGGLRYAAILLKDPVGRLKFKTLETDGEIVGPFSLGKTYSDVAADLDIADPYDVTIKITEDANVDGGYKVEATYYRVK